MTLQSGQSFQAHWIQIEKRDPFFCEIHFFDENLRYFDANVLFFVKISFVACPLPTRIILIGSVIVCIICNMMEIP